MQWVAAQLDSGFRWPLGDNGAGPWWSWIPLALMASGVIGGWAVGGVRLLRAGHPERLQRAWLLVVVAAVVVTQSLGSGPVASALQAVALWLLPVAIAVGVLRYNLLGIDTVLPRAVTAGVLALTVTVVYLVVAAVGELAGAGRVGPALAASLVVSAVLVPLRDRLRAGVDRFLYGRQEIRAQLQRDLHDGLGPALTGMRLGLTALDDALADGDNRRAGLITAALKEEADRSVVEVRRILDGLRPADLDGVDLGTPLRRRVAGGAATAPVRVTVADLPTLSPAVEDGVFRVVTEAVHNAHQHAGARDVSVSVSVSSTDSRLVVRVVDDGSGFAESAKPGIGLASMRARAAELGGRLDLDTSNAGTEITFTVPLAAPRGS